MSERLSIDGVEVAFETGNDGRFRVLADGREIGQIELARESTELLAFRPDGEPLRTHSKWGGEITARFGSREIAARALLDAMSRGTIPKTKQEQT